MYKQKITYSLYAGDYIHLDLSDWRSFLGELEYVLRTIVYTYKTIYEIKICHNHTPLSTKVYDFMNDSMTTSSYT